MAPILQFHLAARARVVVVVFGQPRCAVGVDALEQRLVADMDLLAFEHLGHGNDQRELPWIALVVVEHADHGALAVAHQDDLGGLVEQPGVGLADVEAAEGMRLGGGQAHGGGADQAGQYAGHGKLLSSWHMPAVNAGGGEGVLTIRRFEAAGLTWPLPDDVTDTALEARLFASAGAGPGTRQGHRRQAEPDWAAVHRELKRKHVTLSILWEEYIAAEPGGYRYSRFCELYRAWEGRLSVTMRQSHAAGDKLFVDYAGDGVPVVIDRLTGERRSAQIFVAVLGASSFTYAQATWTQALADWISGHVGAFEAIGGVPALLVPDNTKVAVIKACLYDPQINRTYADMAAHYGTAILPARPRRPRDKAKVEAGGAHGRALAARAAAPPHLPQPRRGQRGDRRAADAAQRGAADPAARRDPPQAVRGDRPAGAQALAGRALTCSPSGGSAGSASTITSRSRRTTTASRIASSAPRSRCASPPAPSRSSTRASGSPRISA